MGGVGGGGGWRAASSGRRKGRAGGGHLHKKKTAAARALVTGGRLPRGHLNRRFAARRRPPRPGLQQGGNDGPTATAALPPPSRGARSRGRHRMPAVRDPSVPAPWASGCTRTLAKSAAVEGRGGGRSSGATEPRILALIFDTIGCLDPHPARDRVLDSWVACFGRPAWAVLPPAKPSTPPRAPAPPCPASSSARGQLMRWSLANGWRPAEPGPTGSGSCVVW